MLRIADSISASASSLRRLQRLSCQSAERLIRSDSCARHAHGPADHGYSPSLATRARALSIFATDRTPRLLSGSQLPSSSCQKALKLRTCFRAAVSSRSRNDFLSSRNGGEAAFLILLLPLKQQAGLDTGYHAGGRHGETFIPGSIVCWIMAIFS